MGKIRVAKLGDEKSEKEQKRKAEARRQTKDSKKVKVEGVGMHGGERVSVVEGTDIRPEFKKLIEEVESGEKPEVSATKHSTLKKSSGSSTISYTCSGGTNNTNILTTTGQNILVCTQINTVSVSYTGTGATATLTPTPTLPAGTSPTSTPTPTSIPSSNTVPICASLFSDITSGIGTPLAVVFTCSGVDTDGYINAAEFTFGDGSSQVIEKNAGSPGTLSTTHTFTTIGTLGTSCRVRDNNQVYSTVTDTCKKIVTIKKTPIVTASTQVGSTTIVRTVTPIPTPQIVTIISETPEPTVLPTATPTPPFEQTARTNGSNRFWWIIGGVIAIGAAFILLGRRPPPPLPPVPPMNTPTNENQPLQPQAP